MAADNVHGPSIDCLRHRGLTEGVTADRYLPAGLVSRGQMASFVARLIEQSGGDLPDHPSDAFADDDGLVHESSINKAAWAGVVIGFDDGRYEPSGLVRRDQVASFAIRALDLVVTRPSWERAVELIHACRVDGAFQVHDLSASLDLKYGTSHRTTQPHIDAVAAELNHAGCPGPVVYGTE